MAQIKTPAGIMVEVDDKEAERRLARSVRALMLDDWPLVAGACAPVDRRRIDADPELAAFLSVVAKAGGWSEERLRVARQRLGPAPPQDPGEIGPGPLAVSNIVRILPTWRAWGRLVIEAEKGKAAGRDAGFAGAVGGDGGQEPAPVEDGVAVPRRR